MSINLHKTGLEHAIELIDAGEVDTFDTKWEEVKPTHDEMTKFINTHFMKEYGLWFLGTDTRYPKDAKEHYVYPFGDLKMVQVSALTVALHDAKKNGDTEIADAAQRLISLIEKKHK